MIDALADLAALLAWSNYSPTTPGPPWRFPRQVAPGWLDACAALEVVELEDGHYGVTDRTYWLAEAVVREAHREALEARPAIISGKACQGVTSGFVGFGEALPPTKGFRMYMGVAQSCPITRTA